jgi:serine/threonine-protein kinase
MHADASAETVIRPAYGLDRLAASPRRADTGGEIAPAPPTPGGRRRADRKNRRVLIGAGLVVLLGAAVYAWSLTAETPKNAANSSAAPPNPPSVVAPDGNCVVSYAVWSDDGSRFRAQLTIANRDEQEISNWQLWFIMNGDQVVSGKVNQGGAVPVSAPRIRLDQQGEEVTLRSAATLSPQSAASVTIDGRYDQSNAAPMAFKLDGRTCETFVSGKPGAPSLPVEHLSNGGVRLGPKPTTSTPAPGITIDARGIAHVRPTTRPSPSASVPASQPATQPAVGSSSSSPPAGGGGQVEPNPPTPTATTPAPPSGSPSIASPDPVDTNPVPPGPPPPAAP